MPDAVISSGTNCVGQARKLTEAVIAASECLSQRGKAGGCLVSKVLRGTGGDESRAPGA